MYGQGIYFADNSAYSHPYTATETINGVEYHCMFVAFVLPGESAKDPRNDPRKLRIPPLRNEFSDSVERYDSVMNRDGTHTIIYANKKSYPAYLIRYKV